MLKLAFNSFLILVLFQSCGGNNDNKTEENQEIIKLRNEIRRLENENAEKEALIDESLTVFAEIQENVARIQHKENEIRVQSEFGIKSEGQKEWLIQELKNIQYLRDENNRKISALNKQIQGKEQLIGQLYQMLESLQEKLLVQDALITELQNSLKSQDSDYSKLFDAYLEQSTIADDSRKELAKAFYVYGSIDELKKNNVIIQSKGFIGMGKKSSLKDGFNEDYFTQINKFEQDKINIIGKKINIVSDHPSSSYQIIDKGANKTIQITNVYDFWKISKYLVVIVD